MKNLHPDYEYAGPIRQDSVTEGRNRDESDYPESGYIKCLKCGYTMNKYRHAKPKARGAGVSFDTDSYTIESTTQYYGDPTVNTGCPLCGTWNYE